MGKMLIPPDDLDVVGLGTVYAGQPVDVPDEIAGVAADPRREKAMQELTAAIEAREHAKAQTLRNEIGLLEPGYGLLGQGWKLAPAVSKDSKPAAPAAPAAEEKGDGQ